MQHRHDTGLHSKRFQLSFLAKFRAGAKKNGWGNGRGEGGGGVSFSPLPLPIFLFFFALVST